MEGLLAVIHRDGGDHYAQVGEEQAVRDAHVVWADLVRERDEARAENARLAAALAEVREAVVAYLACDDAVAEEEGTADVVAVSGSPRWRLDRFVADAPADLAAARDARARAEALRAMMRSFLLAADVHQDSAAESRSGIRRQALIDAAAQCSNEAERIERGGR